VTEAAALAERIVAEAARLLGASDLVPVASAHIDGCRPSRARISTAASTTATAASPSPSGWSHSAGASRCRRR
jgi:hypothetical protein